MESKKRNSDMVEFFESLLGVDMEPWQREALRKIRDEEVLDEIEKEPISKEPAYYKKEALLAITFVNKK